MAMTREACKIETHLVLAAPVAESVQLDTICRYQSLPIQNIIMTKLDETPRYGSTYNLLSQAGIPVSYLSAGQRVPEDLEAATRQRLVDLVWGKAPSMGYVDTATLVGVAH